MAPGIPTAMERPHFIGIGGAGMSGIAKILVQRGAKVAGSDAKESATAEALRQSGSEAVGQVIEAHPLDKLKSVVEEAEADEVIVLTAPHYVEEFFHRDWASRARHKVGVPVLKLFAHSE